MSTFQEYNSKFGNVNRKLNIKGMVDVVCFDIGTYGSGYAYHIKESDNIYLNTTWKGEKIKTNTCLLIKDIGKALSYISDEYERKEYMLKPLIETEKIFIFGDNAKEEFENLVLKEEEKEEKEKEEEKKKEEEEKGKKREKEGEDKEKEEEKENKNLRNVIIDKIEEKSKKDKNYYYFEHFKMSLYNVIGNENIRIQCKNIESYWLDAEKVFALCILYLRKHVTDRLINDNNFFNIERTKFIQWIVTVPAIWNLKAKEIMRNASIMAGLCNKNDINHQLKLALEPEVAALFAAQDLKQFKQTTGVKYLLIDAGGGTIDIVAHEVIDDKNSVKEIYQRNGSSYGSTKINEEFITKILYTMFGKLYCENLRKKNIEVWHAIMEIIDVKKITYKGGLCRIGPLPYKFVQGLNKTNIELKYNNNNIAIKLNKSGNLEISEEFIKENIFNPIIDNIGNTVDLILNKPILQDINYVILVGGFANNVFLQDKLKLIIDNINKKNKSHIQFYRPHAPETCVLKGSCIYGQCHDLVVSRKSSYTYGIDIASTNLQYYNERRPYFDDYGKLVVGSVFKKIININQDVSFDEKFIVLLGRGSKNKKAKFNFVQSLDPNVKYVDEDLVKIIGNLSIRVPDGINILYSSNLTLEEAREVWFKVCFQFGTEIFVTATCVKNNAEKKITLKFNNF